MWRAKPVFDVLLYYKYGFLYLLGIPLFAMLYAIHSSEFYYPAMQYDREVLQLTEAKITKGFDSVFNEKLRRRVPSHDKYSVTTLDVKAEGRMVSFLLLFGVETDTTPKTFRLTSKLDVTVDGDNAVLSDGTSYRIVPGPNSAPVIEREVEEPYAIIGATVRALPFDDSVAQYQMSESMKTAARKALFVDVSAPDRVAMEVPAWLWNDLSGYSRAVRGFPDGIRDALWRMLYLSAVTITTLGYGDMVPVSSRTRALVGVEAVYGVVMAGLFLNSVARKRDSNLNSVARKRDSKRT